MKNKKEKHNMKTKITSFLIVVVLLLSFLPIRTSAEQYQSFIINHVREQTLIGKPITNEMVDSLLSELQNNYNRLTEVDINKFLATIALLPTRESGVDDKLVQALKIIFENEDKSDKTYKKPIMSKILTLVVLFNTKSGADFVSKIVDDKFSGDNRYDKEIHIDAIRGINLFRTIETSEYFGLVSRVNTELSGKLGSPPPEGELDLRVIYPSNGINKNSDPTATFDLCVIGDLTIPQILSNPITVAFEVEDADGKRQKFYYTTGKFDLYSYYYPVPNGKCVNYVGHMPQDQFKNLYNKNKKIYITVDTENNRISESDENNNVVLCEDGKCSVYVKPVITPTPTPTPEIKPSQNCDWYLSCSGDKWRCSSYPDPAQCNQIYTTPKPTNKCVFDSNEKKCTELVPTPSPEPEISPTPKPKPATGVSVERALDLDNLKGKLTSNEISGIAQKVSDDYQTLTKEDKEFILNLPEEIKKKGLEKEESADDNIANMISNVFSKESDEDSWIKSARSIGKLSGQTSFNFLNFLLEKKISGPSYYSDRFYSEVIEAAKDNGDPRLLKQVEAIKFVQETGGQDVLVESVNICSGDSGSGADNECDGSPSSYYGFDFAGGGYVIQAGLRNFGVARNVLITTSVVDPSTGNLIARRISKEVFLDGSQTLVLTSSSPLLYLRPDGEVSVKIEIRDFDTGYKNLVTGKFGPGKKELTTPIAKRYGILLSNSKDNTIQSNIITPVTGVHASLHLLSSTGNNLISNKISAVGSGHGILLESSSNKNRLSSNVVLTRGKGSYGIYLKGSDDVTMANDIILSTTSKDVVAKKADLKLVNVSFNKEKTAFEDEASLEDVGVLDVSIKDSQTKQLISGVKIEIKDSKGNKVVDESLTSGQRKGFELLRSKLNAIRDSSVTPLSTDSTKATAESGRPIPPLMPLGGDSWSFLPEYQPGESVYEGVNELPIIAPEPMPPSGGIIARADSGKLSFSEYGNRLSFQENSPPVFTSTPPTKAFNGKTYKYLVTVADPDNNTPYFILVVNSTSGYVNGGPDGMNIEQHNNGSALVTWNPIPSQVGKTFSLLVAVDDQQGAVNSVAVQTFNIEVGGNSAPDIKTDAPTSGIVGAEYRYDIIASDPDKDPLKITLVDKPTGMTIVDSGDGTATVKWTPQQTGRYNAKIAVDDGKGLENSLILEPFSINVETPGGSGDSTSESPVVGVRVEEEKALYTLTAEASGYEKSSMSIDLSKIGSVEVFLVKSGGSGIKAPAPVTAPQSSAPAGETSSRSSSSGSSISSPTIRSVTPVAITSKTSTKNEPSVKVDRQLVDILVKVGRAVNVNEIIPIINNGNKDLDLEIQLKGIDKLSVDQSKLKLAPGEQKTIKVTGLISGLEAGTYTGKVIIKPEGLEAQEVKILLTVQPAEQEKLFDLVLDFDKKVTVFAGDDLEVSTKVVNVAGQAFDVKVRYRLKDFDGNVILEETEDVKSSDPTKTFVKTFKTGSVKPGNYVVEASILDGQQEVAVAALSSHLNTKSVKGGGAESGPAGGTSLFLPIIVVIVLAIAFAGLKFLKGRK